MYLEPEFWAYVKQCTKYDRDLFLRDPMGLLQFQNRHNTNRKVMPLDASEKSPSGFMRQSACLVLNPITVYSYGFLFNCTTVGQVSDSMTALT